MILLQKKQAIRPTFDRALRKDHPIDIEVKTFGQILKEAREKRGLSLEQIAQQTKIHLQILEGLENEDFSHLPSKIYLRGFAKTFASVIGLDPVTVAQNLDEAYSKGFSPINQHHVIPTMPEKGAVKIHPEINRKFHDKIFSLWNPLSRNPKKAGILAGVATVLIVGILIALINAPDKYRALLARHQAVQPIETPNPAMTADAVSSDTPIAPATQPDTITVPVVAEKTVAAPVTIGTPASVTTPTPMPTPASTPIPKKGKGPQFRAIFKGEDIILPMYVVMEKADASIPDDIRAKIGPEKQNIYIHAFRDDIWLAYKRDDGPINSIIIRKDKSIFIQGSLVLLYMGNSNAAHVFLNDKLLDVKTKSSVKALIFPESEASKFKIPLFVRDLDGKFHTFKEYQKIIGE